MLKAILIDNELHGLDTLGILLKTYCPHVDILASCQSAQDGLEAIAKNNPDILFLDIEMPVMNGFQMLEQFSSIPFSVIFTTSYDQYAIKAIRFSALDYLLKPIDPAELIAAIYKVQTQKHLPLAEQFQLLLNKVQLPGNQFSKIAVPTAEGFELIPADQVIRCEADDNYSHLFLKNKDRITATRTLKEIEEQL